MAMWEASAAADQPQSEKVGDLAHRRDLGLGGLGGALSRSARYPNFGCIGRLALRVSAAMLRWQIGGWGADWWGVGR